MSLSRQETQFEPGEASDLALRALVWILSDDRRAERLLSLTGLTPDALRGGLDDAVTQLAVLDFLAAHETDLIGAADAAGVSPERLAAAHTELAR